MKPDMPVQAKSENAKEGTSASHIDPSEDLFADYAFSDKDARPDAFEQDFDATPAPAAWYASLPRLTREQARLSEAIDALPPALSRQALNALIGVLALYTHNTPGDIAFQTFEIEETGEPFARSLSEPSVASAPRVYALLDLEPSGARVTAETDAAFAASLVNLVLGGEGSAPHSLRPLSRAELAVVEFLWLYLVRGLNELARAPLWRVDAVTSDVPVAGRADGRKPQVSRSEEKDDTSATGRVLVLPLRLTVGGLSGLVRFYFTAATLGALNEAGNPLLSKRPGRRARLSRWAQIAPEVSLRLSVGETKLTGAELSQLETGDVVLVSAPHVEWHGGRLKGRVLLLAGDARNLQIRGMAQAAELFLEQAPGEASATEALTIAVEAASVSDAPVAVGHLRMNEEQTDEYEDAGGLSIERLALTLRVELATRNVTLEELARLRPGQLLDLGCKPTDPVDLVAGGRRVASGELVDFEGQLGVRIMEVYLVLHESSSA